MSTRPRPRRLRNLLIRVRGGEPLPRGVGLYLSRGERVLTWGRVRGGRLAVATDFQLVVMGSADEPDPPKAYPWHEIARATWANGELLVEQMDGAVATYQLSEPRGVPAAIREHVTASLTVSEHHELAPGVGVRIVARRNLATGALVWSAIFDAGVDGSDPVRQQHAKELLAAVRRRHGG